ncbi:MAG: hypothetical protein DRO23_10170 [Thermoprotei archaeon]|nr:MAG: hypothetical protein DRO23_10170 [Thermoprotei archaeon]
MFNFLRKHFSKMIREHSFEEENIIIEVRPLSKEEAIGKLNDREFALVRGEEVLIEALFKGAIGQAFTDEPSEFHGKLEEIVNLRLTTNKERALFIASLNAVMRYLGLVKNTKHCKDNGPWICAEKLLEYIKRNYGRPKIAIIGYQPAFVKKLSEVFEVRVTDMCEKNIGKKKFGVLVESYLNNVRVSKWADIVLATGSSIVNNTLHELLPFREKLILYGVTCAGVSRIMGLRRWCISEEI